MSRVAIADRDDLRRGAWTAEEDEKLRAYVGSHGTGHWRSVGRKAGLQRCGKSCRLRWTNYLRPNIRHGSFTPYEEDLIVKLHSSLGSRWSLIAARMPGRTDNDIKNHWNTRLKKKLCNMGIDPVTHKPISELLRDIAGTMQSDGSSAAGCNDPMAAAGEEAARRCFSDNLLRRAVRDYSRTSAAASAPAGPSKYTDHSVISGAACAAPDFNLHSCSDTELEQSAGDRQYCGDVSTLAAQSTSSLIQNEAAVVVDEDLHSWEHSISSTTSNCMSGHRNSCSEVDEVNLERSTSRSPSSRSMQSLQVNSTSSRSKNNMEAAASCWGSQLNITTDRRHHHLHHAADYTSPGTSPAAFLYLPTAPPLAAASSIKENNPTNNLELSFKSSRDQHHGNLIKELHEISRQFFPAASHGSCRSSTPTTTTTTTTSGSRSSTTASQLVQRPPPPPVHNFLSDRYGDHQLVPCSWRTTSSMNAATAAAAAGTSTTSSSAASTLQVDELAAAVQLLPCSSNKLQQYAVPMSSSRFSTDQSNLQLHIIKQHQQQPYFNFSDTFDMDLMKTRPHHIQLDQRQQQQQQQEDHHVENSMIIRHEYYDNQINPAGLNFNQLQVTSDLELPAAAARGAYLRTQLREPISSRYNNNAAAAIVTSSSPCTAHVAAPHETLMSSFAAAATGSPSALSSSSFTNSAGPAAAAAAAALHISNFSTGAPDPPLTMTMTTPASGMNSTQVHGHHSYDHQNIQTSRVQVLWDFHE